MGRINSLVGLTALDIDALKPIGLFESDGPRADVLRAIVVFLHATFEDVLRRSVLKHDKKFTFYKSADIDKALRKRGLDPTPFKPLYPPLGQMAKRRNRIVHNADLSNKTDTSPETWTFADEWQLIMWMMAVLAFHSRLLMSIYPEDQVARETYSNLRAAMDELVNFAKQLLTVPESEPEMRTNALQTALDTVTRILMLLEASKNARIAARNAGRALV